MKERFITIDPFDFIVFNSAELTQCIGEHGTAKIVGIIPLEKAEVYLSTGKHLDKVTVNLHENGESKTIFNGIVSDISAEFIGNLATMTLLLISHSFLMDIEKHTRTFQDKNMNYKELVNTMTEDSGIGNIIVPNHSDATIGEMFVQYKETDWEFANRVASRLNTYALTDHLLGSPHIAIGMVNSQKGIPIVFNDYTIKIDNAKQLIEKENGINTSFIAYEASSREHYNLCNETIFSGKQLYVFKTVSKLVGEEFVHYYTLKPKMSIAKHEYRNKKTIGMSLIGNVIEIDKDMVKVKIKNDVQQTEHKWFSYATVYSSPDNTGWYFMPELGDEIKLYFPTEVENDAYVISSVHLDERSDADTKSIRTKWGKEVVFTPTSIHISNGAGETIKLDDAKGLFIDSTKKIKITAEDSLTIDAIGKIQISSGDKVVINQTGNQITVDDNIDISAGHVRIR